MNIFSDQIHSKRQPWSSTQNKGYNKSEQILQKYWSNIIDN